MKNMLMKKKKLCFIYFTDGPVELCCNHGDAYMNVTYLMLSCFFVIFFVPTDKVLLYLLC